MANTPRSGSPFTDQGKESGTGTMEKKDFGGNIGRNQGDRGGNRGQENQGFQQEEQQEEGQQGIMGRVGELAGTATGRAGEAVSAISGRASEAASAVAERAKNAASSVGSGIKSLGETIRQHGPHTGVLGTASEGIAGTLETSGSFLQEKGLAGITDELTSCVKNHPMTAVLVSLGCGYLLGCLTSRR